LRIHNTRRFSPEFLAKVAEKVGEMDKERRKHERWVAIRGDITPPVSMVWNGARLVGAGGTIYKSGPDSSWYGFLYDHLQTVMGMEWFAKQAEKTGQRR
jgi:hypothetical protein